LFRFFSPFEVVSAPLIRIGRMADGGYVMADCFAGTRAAFSFGIDGEVSWDHDIAQHSFCAQRLDLRGGVAAWICTQLAQQTFAQG
jgi:hypothetical protein